MIESMFHLQVPLLEKIVRPIIIYFFLIFLLRIFGKRELAQLNPFDLIVLLSLSNVVQNALIGNDNSVTGGIVGAFSLLAINWLVVRYLYGSPRANRIVEGTERILIRDGVVDQEALHRELMTEQELLSAVHRQGFDGTWQIQECVLAPNGSLYFEGRKPSEDEQHHAEIMTRLEAIQRELATMRKQLPAG